MPHTSMSYGDAIVEAWIVLSLRNVWQKLKSSLLADSAKLLSNARLSLYSNAAGVRRITRNNCSPAFNYCKRLAAKAATDF